MSKDSYYFSHDSNARHDPKIIALMEKVGLEGYRYFFVLIEILREQQGYILPKKLAVALAKEWQTHGSAMTHESILDAMLEIGLIESNDNGYFSPSLCERMGFFDEVKKKRSNAGRKGAEALWQTHGKRMAKDGKESKVKESKGKETKTPVSFGFDFESLWLKYPKRDGKKDALRHFKSSVKTEQDWIDINKALQNYIKSEQVQKGFIKNGSTWFYNWRDWVANPVSKPNNDGVPEEWKTPQPSRR